MKHVFLIAGLLICGLVNANIKASHETIKPRHQVAKVQNTEQQIDSMISTYPDGRIKSKIIYFYDTQDRISEVYEYGYFGEAIAQDSTKEIFTYKGNEESQAIYDWDNATNQWKCRFLGKYVNELKVEEIYYGGGLTYDRYLYEYNDRQEQTLFLCQKYNEQTNQYEDAHKEETTYTYNGSLKVLEVTYEYGWDYNKTLVMTGKREVGYDNTGRLLSDFVYGVQDGQLVNRGKTEYEYADGGFCTGILYGWEGSDDTDPSVGSWYIDSKMEYQYDENGNCLQRTIFYYSQDKTWLPSSRDTYTYQGDLLLEEVYAFWNKETEAWEYMEKGTYQYNEYDNPLCFIASEYDTTTHTFIEYARYTYYYKPTNSTGINNLFKSNMDSRKVIENGIIYIICNGEWYTVDGLRVK